MRQASKIPVDQSYCSSLPNWSGASSRNRYATTTWAIAQRQDAPFTEPLNKYRQLEEVTHKDWLLSTSDLAAILGVKPRPDMERYSYRFLRTGKNGSETAWKVVKL